MNKLLIPLLLLLLSACSNTPTDERPTLTVSIEPLRYIVESIAGNRYQVQTLMPQGGSPETYEPTPRQMMELNSSRTLFRVGTLGFEKTILEQMAEGTPNLEIVNLDEGIKPLFDHNHKHDGMNSADPHIWMSTENLKLMAGTTCKALCAIDSTNTSFYRQRLDLFLAKMDSLDTELKNITKPIANRSFLIYHPALGYFARQYGLLQLSVEHDGKEPSAAYLKQLINKCKSENVTTVFISKEHTGRAAHRISDALHVKPTTINPLDYDIPAQLRHIANELKND